MTDRQEYEMRVAVRAAIRMNFFGRTHEADIGVPHGRFSRYDTDRRRGTAAAGTGVHHG